MSDRTEGGPAGLPLPLIADTLTAHDDPPQLAPSAPVALWLLCQAWQRAVRDFLAREDAEPHACAAVVWTRPQDAQEAEAAALEVAARLDSRRPPDQQGGFTVHRRDYEACSVLILRGTFR